eukprot:6180169-Pleurochrysis_carterae.AAC.3
MVTGHAGGLGEGKVGVTSGLAGLASVGRERSRLVWQVCGMESWSICGVFGRERRFCGQGRAARAERGWWAVMGGGC